MTEPARKGAIHDSGDIRRDRRSAIALLVTAVAGLGASLAAGLALVPRVRLVEVLTVLAGGIGSGAALVWAIVQLRRARSEGL